MSPKRVHVEVPEAARNVPAKYRGCRRRGHDFPDIADHRDAVLGRRVDLKMAPDWLTVTVRLECGRCGVVRVEERFTVSGQYAADPRYERYPDGYLMTPGEERVFRSDFVALAFADLFPKAVE